MPHLRPIAPLEEQMPRPDPYAAMQNPPRQAKRARTSASLSPVIGPSAHAAPPHSLPSPEEDEPAPKRRGRKASSTSRAAREAQRKMNHSIIEKARRTKINDALATLRVLVPAQPKRGGEDEEDEAEAETGKEEKEFKLDVLVRTVTYLQDLTERVKTLETAQGSSKCTSCQSSKRKRDDKEQEDTVEEPQPQSVPAETSTRLPSISSWISLDPALMRKPNPSPSALAATQLPSPPGSTTFRPSVSTQTPPIFALPAAQDRSSTAARSRGGSTQTSPILSPLATRTPEDESVASMLLSMGASSRRNSSASERERTESEVLPWTPGSMLGLTKT
ncbi:hypothetical protein HWV62_43690 [Athelia sp. TMB]|nr:hypothetical protein HWV62_43690 [Athelia sp. TMB]